MVAYGYTPSSTTVKENEEKPKLTLDDIFFPPIINQLTSTVENQMLNELRNFWSVLSLRTQQIPLINKDQILMIIARRFLGKDLRKMSPVVVVGERALEETERKGRTASVLAISPCE